MLFRDIVQMYTRILSISAPLLISHMKDISELDMNTKKQNHSIVPTWM